MQRLCPLPLTAALAAALFLTACAEPGRYPVTGAECGPDDPVKTLDASDCLAAPGGTGTF